MFHQSKLIARLRAAPGTFERIVIRLKLKIANVEAVHIRSMVNRIDQVPSTIDQAGREKPARHLSMRS